MRNLSTVEQLVIAGGHGRPDAAGCRSDAANGFGIGATVGATIGSVAGPIGTVVGTLAGGLAGGAAAVSNSPDCGGGSGGGNNNSNGSTVGGNGGNSGGNFGGGFGDGGGGGGGGRVICTHLMRQGLLDPAIWRADLLFTYKHLSPTTVRGYHLWAVPYVRLMRKSPLAQKLIRPLATWRAEELAYQMGVLQKSNWKGKILRWIGEPICFALGVFAKEQNWQSLWEGQPQHVETTPAA